MLRSPMRALGAGLLAAWCTVVHADGAFHVAVPPDRLNSPPHTVLLAQPELVVKEVTAGNLEEPAQDWSREASEKAVQVMRVVAKKTGAFEVVDDSRLTGADRASVRQYSALYLHLMSSIEISRHSGNPAWRERVARFDYTVGPGMSEIASRANADAVLFLVGSDHVSSTGRQARRVGGVLMGLVTRVFVLPKTGASFLSVGMVDLRSGDLLWVSGYYDEDGGINLRKEKYLDEVFTELFASYPWQPRSADKDNGK